MSEASPSVTSVILHANVDAASVDVSLDDRDVQMLDQNSAQSNASATDVTNQVFFQKRHDVQDEDSANGYKWAAPQAISKSATRYEPPLPVTQS